MVSGRSKVIHRRVGQEAHPLDQVGLSISDNNGWGYGCFNKLGVHRMEFGVCGKLGKPDRFYRGIFSSVFGVK